MTVPEPSACRWCGIPERPHCQRWKEPIGWHQHTPPTQAQILDRMKTRRASKETT